MQTWKAKDFVVMLTFDGLDKVDKSTKQLLSTGGGFFSEPLIDLQKLNGRQRPFVHMFQRTVRVKDGTEFVKFVSLFHGLADTAAKYLACLSPTCTRCTLSILPFSQPIRVIVCIKSKNAGKLRSQQWQLNHVAKQIQPKYVVLLDAGTKPKEKSMLILLREMEENPQLAGVCGTIQP